MSILRFYDTLADMECMSGDTLPEFFISADTDLTGCEMHLILEDLDSAQTTRKDCTPSDSGFTVQLTSKDTAGLRGVYNLHFVLTDAAGLAYRKLVGTLVVLDTPKGGA